MKKRRKHLLLARPLPELKICPAALLGLPSGLWYEELPWLVWQAGFFMTRPY
jgi:hypothetical protein